MLTAGVMESMLTDAGVPAAWVAQLPERGRAAIAGLAAAPAAAPTLQRPVVGARVLRPTTIEYELQDRLTGARRKVLYRSDGPAGELDVLTAAVRPRLGVPDPSAGSGTEAATGGSWTAGNCVCPPAVSARNAELD